MKHLKFRAADGKEVWGMKEMTQYVKAQNKLLTTLIAVIGSAIAVFFMAVIYLWLRFSNSALYPALLEYLLK